MLSTWSYIEQRHGHDGFLCRYPPEPDPENLFAACTFWLAEDPAGLGKIDEARRCFERLLDAGTDLGLYAEELDVRTRGPVGNFPQAFTNVALISAALATMPSTSPGTRIATRRGPAPVVAPISPPSLRACCSPLYLISVCLADSYG